MYVHVVILFYSAHTQTLIGEILVAVNPFKTLPFYSNLVSWTRMHQSFVAAEIYDVILSPYKYMLRA